MKIIKTSILAVVLVSTAHTALADRGIGKKAKNKVTLNIGSNYSTIRNSLFSNLKNGLTYRGSILVKKQFSANSVYNNTLVTFQKGNTIYVIPYKNRIVMPEIKQGYTGVKIRIPVH
jgi:hypothetical protein